MVKLELLLGQLMSTPCIKMLPAVIDLRHSDVMWGYLINAKVLKAFDGWIIIGQLHVGFRPSFLRYSYKFASPVSSRELMETNEAFSLCFYIHTNLRCYINLSEFCTSASQELQTNICRKPVIRCKVN